MGLFNSFKEKVLNEFIDIIEWTDGTPDTIVWRFPRYQSEIKNGAQLTVRESQVAVLVNEGQFADVFQPGRYQLTTSNMPILSTLKGWKYGFNSPFKVDVYFVNTKQFINLHWGTPNPIMLRDPEFGPIRIRGFGSYCFQVQSDPTKFMKGVTGTDGNYTTDKVSEQLRNHIITKFTDYLGESKIAALDLAANLNEFSDALKDYLAKDFDDYGIDLTKFLVENISLPENVERALDQRSSIGIIGRNNMGAFTQMQFGNSLEDGANNPMGSDNGMASSAMGMGMAMAMAQQMAQQMQPVQQQQPMQQQAVQQPMQQQAMAPPPVAQQPIYYTAVNGAQSGPYGIQQLAQLAQQGQLKADTMVWTQGMAGWAPAASVQALSQLLASNTPPPPPPPAM